MTLEDLLEIEKIKETRHLYSHYYDGNRLDDLVGLFTDDAVCEFGPDFGGDWVGKDQIRAKYHEFLYDSGRLEHSQMHAVTNPWIRLISDNEAYGRWYQLNLNVAPGAENPLTLFGIYDDVYRKVGDDWKIHRTRIDFLWPNREFYGLRDI
ncbi:MAG: nuclear transport factor 2 family protein [Alphaproteobacteria bacterium]